MQTIFKLIFLGLCLCVSWSVAFAADQPKPRLTLEQKADKARIDSERNAQAQLEKARQAAGETKSREGKIKQQTHSQDWATQQQLKAQKQFAERESREQTYLQDAKDAATKEHKIPQP